MKMLLCILTTIFISGCVGDKESSNIKNEKQRFAAEKQMSLKQKNDSSPLTNSDILGASFYSNGDQGGTPNADEPSCLQLNNFDLAINTGEGKKIENYIEFSNDKSEKLSQFTLNIDVKGSYGLFSAYANSAMDNIKAVQENQLRFIYHANGTLPVIITPKKEIGRDITKMLDPGVIDYYNEGLKSGNYSNFINQCGTRYVNQFAVGQSLSYEFTLNFKDSTQKNLFALDAGASYGNLFDLTTKLQQFNSSHDSKIAISIVAKAVGVRGEMPIPEIPTTCLDIKTLAQCPKNIVDSVNNYINNNNKEIESLIKWLADNPNKSYFEKLARFQGMKGIANNGNYLNYTKAYTSAIDIAVNEDLIKMQQRIYKSIKDMATHTKIINNVVPLLSEWGIGLGDKSFIENLGNLKKQRDEINSFADNISIGLSSTNSYLAKNCFRNSSDTCKKYFDNYLNEILQKVELSYKYIDEHIAGNYYYTKNQINDRSSDYSYLGLQLLGIGNLFPIITNTNIINTQLFYTRFQAPIDLLTPSKSLTKDYFNLGNLSYPVKMVFNKSNITVEIAHQKSISLSCEEKINRDREITFDCSKKLQNKKLIDFGIDENDIKDLYLDPENFIFYQPAEPTKIIELFKNIFLESLNRSNYHDFTIKSNPIEIDPAKINLQSAILTPNTKWFSPNRNYYLLLEPMSSKDGYSLILKKVNDSQFLKSYVVETNLPIAFAVFDIRPHDISNRYYLDLRFYDFSNKLVKQEIQEITSNIELLDSSALLVGDDGNLYITNRNAAFTGNLTNGYRLTDATKYNQFIDYLDGKNLSFQPININISNLFFK